MINLHGFQFRYIIGWLVLIIYMYAADIKQKKKQKYRY